MKHSFSWLTPKAQKSRTVHGFGIFAKQNIKKAEKIIVFGGYVMNNHQFDNLSLQLKHLPFQIDENLYFGLYKISEMEPADFLNHSCDPNCGFFGEITVVALRNINKGEEICIDYATCSDNYRSLTKDMQNCLCGAKNCRKKISTHDWKNKKLQKKYKGFFQPFLEKKIKRKS